MTGFAKRHVLGIAFPHTDIDEARGAELERCFLQLAYAVGRLRTGRQDAVGYLAVLSQGVRDSVQRLTRRYDAGDSVRTVFASLLVADMTRLADAATSASVGDDPSVATSVAREIAVGALRREVALREPGVVEHAVGDRLPYGVAWDYCGTVQATDGE